MKRTTRFLLALSLAACACAGVHAQDDPIVYGRPGCRIAPLEPSPPNDRIDWDGGCKDGFASGPGELVWSADKGDDHHVKGTLVRGEVQGEATLTIGKYSYIGTLKHGVPDGTGYEKYASGGQYEGGFRMDKRDGQGVYLSFDRSRYEGEWKDNYPHGIGRMSFGLGGSYEGEWKDGRFDGAGTIVYAGSGRRYQGQFKDGRIVGAAAPEVNKAGKFEVVEASPLQQWGAWPGYATTNLPPEASWDQLSPAQQSQVRANYLALEDGDEPPYPVGGPRGLIKVAIKASGAFEGAEGSLLLYVLVATDGSAKSVTAVGSPDPQLTRHVALAAMAQRYKPAVCHGQPCEMIYPIWYKFGP